MSNISKVFSCVEDRRARKLAVSLLALVLMACGGGDDDRVTTEEENTAQGQDERVIGAADQKVASVREGLFNVGEAAQVKVDHNGDGKSDLLWHNDVTGQTTMWLMNGTGTIGSGLLLTDPNFKILSSVDLNGDGKSDLLWYNSGNSGTGQTSAWMMNGAAIIGSRLLLTDQNFKIIETGDFNGDGKSDLLWYNDVTGQTTVWLMNGTTVIESKLLLTDANFKIVGVVDLNGDGKSDLLWYNPVTGQTTAWIMNGAFSSNSRLLLTDSNFKLIGAGDLNGDAKSDLFWYNGVTGQTTAWLMNGNEPIGSVLLLTDPNFRIIRIADVSGDGKSDLLWYNSVTGQTTVWLMNGTTSVASSLLLAHPNFKIAGVGDLNGDGRSDLLWYNAVTGQTTTWLMNGIGIVGSGLLLTDPDFMLALPPEPVFAPHAPLNLRVSGVTTNSLTLSWSDASDNEAGFKILRYYQNLGLFTEIGAVGANVTTYVNTGLNASTSYSYMIRAYNSAGTSSNSNQAGGTTSSSTQTATIYAQASNCGVFNSLDSSVANTANQNKFPCVGINSYWSAWGSADILAFAGVVQFNLSALSGKTIDSATLNLEVASPGVGYYRKNFKIGAVATSWSPASTTWNSMKNFQYYTASWLTFSYPTYSGQTYSINLKSTVQNWVNGAYLNNGIGLLSVDYSTPGNVTSFDAYEFYVPTLTVTYH